MQQSTTIDTLRSDKMSQVTLLKGYWFIFEHEGNDISFQGSIWSGKENTYFNNKRVSSFRNLSSRISEHNFTENGHEYRLCAQVTNLLLGTLKVDLYCDGELLKSETVSQISKKFMKYQVGVVSVITFMALAIFFDLFSRFS